LVQAVFVKKAKKDSFLSIAIQFSHADIQYKRSNDESLDEKTASEPSTVVISNEYLQEKDANTRSTLKETDTAKANCLTKTWHSWCNIYAKYSFLILIVLAVALAKAYPPLGAIYLKPQITATWIAVIFIFCKTIHARGTRVFKAFFNLFVSFFRLISNSPVRFGYQN